MEGAEEERGEGKKNGKQKNTRAAVSMADKSQSPDKAGTNTAGTAALRPQLALEGLPRANHRRAQMFEILMFTE